MLAGVAVALAAAGCSSGSGPAHVPPPVAAVTSHAASVGGGLIGTIDQARLEAVCENARQASTALQTDLGNATLDPFLTAAVGLLQRPPVLAAAQAEGVKVRADLRRGRRDLAVQDLTRFCRDNGG